MKVYPARPDPPNLQRLSCVFETLFACARIYRSATTVSSPTSHPCPDVVLSSDISRPVRRQYAVSSHQDQEQDQQTDKRRLLFTHVDIPYRRLANPAGRTHQQTRLNDCVPSRQALRLILVRSGIYEQTGQARPVSNHHPLHLPALPPIHQRLLPAAPAIPNALHSLSLSGYMIRFLHPCLVLSSNTCLRFSSTDPRRPLTQT